MAINWDAPLDIRDGRNGNWFWVDKVVWQDTRLTSSDKVIYGTLAYFANNKTQASFPSYTTLQKYSGLSNRQCYYSIKRLEQFRYIQIKRVSGKPNLYTLLDTPAKNAVVQNNTTTPANKHIDPLQNSTTNNTNGEQDINNNSDLTFKERSEKIQQLKEKLKDHLTEVSQFNQSHQVN